MLGLTKEQEGAVRRSKSLGTALSIMSFAGRKEGATVEELVDGLGMRPNSLRPRFYELKRTGCLEAVGWRAARSSKQVRVYRPVEGVTFARYVELRHLGRGAKTSKDRLTEVERAVLAAGMKLLVAWQGGEGKRRPALTRFIQTLSRVLRMEDK